MANVGLGSLDGSDDAAKEKAENWYEGMGNYASMNGVTVNVISISDEDCRLENVGRVADMTGGSVDKIDSLEITNNFAGQIELTVMSSLVLTLLSSLSSLSLIARCRLVGARPVARPLRSLNTSCSRQFLCGIRLVCRNPSKSCDCHKCKCNNVRSSRTSTADR